jgi:subtilisin family serine protease
MTVFRPHWVSLFLVAAVLLVVAPVGADSNQNSGKTWNFLPAVQIGAPAFIAENPTYDGRGVAVAILDTGVDVFMPGMLETTTGQVKVIDVRDFSTEGDWETAVAERDESGTDEAPVFRTEDGLMLRGVESLPVSLPAADVANPIYIGIIAEKDFVNSDAVYDLNDDGDNSDKFGFLVWAADRAEVEQALGTGRGYEMLTALNETAAATVAAERLSERVWVVAVDTDGDGDLAGEAVHRDYRVNYDAFALGSTNAPDSRALMAWTLNVLSEEDHLGAPQPPTVEFHFDDGAHGSHCAGIATGHDVSGQEGMNGAAPGAWIISLKLGDNRLAGGATRTSSMKKSYEYAAEFEKKWGIPVVINMSFGIASVEEGDDAMGGWLDDMLAETPNLYVCTSAGNEGPGLSTIGIPATATSLISSGAYLAVETGEDLYNAGMARPSLFNFSSRGGEAPKPDVVAPGGALSTVPGYVDGMARFNGTSMASPQTAGGVALLVSAAQQEGLDIHWGMVKRAIIAGGTPVEGLELFDQGGGLVNVGNSWKILGDLAKSDTAKQVLRYDISTFCPFQSDGQSTAAYWRTPGGVPDGPENVTFRVSPVFHPDLTPDEKDTFFRSFSFKSEAPWLKVVSGDRYIRGDMAMTVNLRYDASQFEKMGAYSARVIANQDGGDLGGLAGREFTLWNTVVVGDEFGPSNDFMRVYEGRDLAQSSAHRYFVDAPAGATAMRVRLEVSEDAGSSRGARVLTEICDPEGANRGGFAGYASVDGDNIKDTTVLTPELRPGTWEILVASSITAEDLSDYRLTVSFDGYHVEPAEVTNLKRKGSGKDASGSLTVTRAFTGVFEGSVSPAVEGFVHEEKVEVEDADTWSKTFTLDATTPRASFHLEMGEKVANYFTDCAVNILDSSGKAVRATGFDGLEAHSGVSLPDGADSATFTLQVVGAFAIAADQAEWGFDLEEKYHLAHPVRGKAKRAGGGPLNLYSGVPTKVKLIFADEWPAAPDGMGVFGSVKFRDSNTDDRRPGDDGGRLVLEVPIRIE